MNLKTGHQQRKLTKQQKEHIPGLFQKIEAEGILSNSFCGFNTKLNTTTKDTIRKENYRSVSLMKIDVNYSRKYQHMESKKVLKKLQTTPSGIYPGYARQVQKETSMSPLITPF